VPYRNPDVTVIGAGVIGLTTAICLAEAGARVAVHAAEPPAGTTSIAAGALWGPHLVGSDERVAGWAEVTLAKFRELDGHAFVHEAAGITATTEADEVPEVAATAASPVECDPGQVPPGYRAAWRIIAPLVSMPEYLAYLHDRYLRAGGAPIVRVSYPALPDAAGAARADGCRVLVNCAGSGARRLVPDPLVVPFRGQVVVARNPGLTEFFVGVGAAALELTYFFPHGDRIVLGGTEQEGDWSLEPDPVTARRIVSACAAVEPALADADVIAHRVGLRPFRPQVRLEAERSADGTVIVHNYGHGGSGVTLSWGCAEDAAATALAALAGERSAGPDASAQAPAQKPGKIARRLASTAGSAETDAGVCAGSSRP
jgi:D-amino-acid oxidase